MSIHCDSTIGPFKIQSLLGKGGMGEVFSAVDTRLNRSVALKVLPAEFGTDTDRLRRFQLEARTLATLNHPNVALVFGFEEHASQNLLVLELVEGETLADRLHRGALPVEETIQIGIQIASALEAAHEKGIIHRDVKPANIKCTPENRVKVLDFGLAKLVTPDSSSSVTVLSDSPTILTGSTLPGLILGTAAYMSPEQAKGKTVDKRTDIWSFGCVLFECLTGKRLFDGETVSDCIGAVLHKEPDWSAVPLNAPVQLQLVLRRCLAKDRTHRLNDMGDARVLLESAETEPFSAAHPPNRSGAEHKLNGRLLAISGVILAFIAAIVAALVLARHPKSVPVARAVTQVFSVNLLEDALLTTATPLGSSIQISPDGTKLAYTGNKDGIFELFWKNANDAEFRKVPDSQRAWPGFTFSPDSAQLVFATSDGNLKSFSFAGGRPRTIVKTAGVVAGIDWQSYNIVFASYEGGVYRIETKEGAIPQHLIGPDKSKGIKGIIHPKFLPDGKHLLVTLVSTNDEPSIAVFDSNAKALAPLGCKGTFNPIYFAPTGHLVYGRDDVLWARPFDRAGLVFTGPEFSLLKDLGRDWSASTHQFSIATNGTLIYARGHQTDPKYQLVLVKQNGKPEPLSLELGDYSFPGAAPDGKSVVSRKGSRLVLISLNHGIPVPIPVTMSSEDDIPFAFDGTNVLISRRENENTKVERIPLSGGAKPELLYQTRPSTFARDLTRDGKLLALQSFNGKTRGDIYLKDLTREGEPRPVAVGSSDESGPSFSPDGKWLAYNSDDGERYDIWLQKVGSAALPVQISKHGGKSPRWSPRGDKIYYLRPNEIVCVKVRSLDPLDLGPEEIFATGRFRGKGVLAGANYDVIETPDGERLLMVKSIFDEPEPSAASQVTAIVHFDEMLRRGGISRSP